MTRKQRSKLIMSALGMLLFPVFTWAQKLDLTLNNEPFERIRIAPESVFKSFSEAGMNPVNHNLSSAEREKVRQAFALLPHLHQRILKTHLHSISFMNNMPNTALMSPVDAVGETKMFNITFRASLLNENISQWATWKENTCFIPTADSGYKVHIEAGNLDAIIYVLMHEATHIVDVVTNITPHPDETNATVEPTTFTKDVWSLMNVPAKPYIDSLLEQTRFRSGKPVAINLAPQVYRKLSNTPFPSLYAMAAWSEDVAELATIYHLTAKLNQPFHVVVTRDHVEIIRFEPMKNALVNQRSDQLATFYKQ